MIICVFDRVENIVGKGENAGYQHFLLFPQCFEKASFSDMSKGVIVWEWVNSLPNNKILDRSKLKAFADINLPKMIIFFVFDRLESIVRNVENTGYQHFLLLRIVLKSLFTSRLCGKD